MSKAASSRYGVPCRVCGAEPEQPCRTLTTGRVTDTHQDRIWQQHVSTKRNQRTNQPEGDQQ